MQEGERNARLSQLARIKYKMMDADGDLGEKERLREMGEYSTDYPLWKES